MVISAGSGAATSSIGFSRSSPSITNAREPRWRRRKENMILLLDIGRIRPRWFGGGASGWCAEQAGIAALEVVEQSADLLHAGVHEVRVAMARWAVPYLAVLFAVMEGRSFAGYPWPPPHRQLNCAFGKAQHMSRKPPPDSPVPVQKAARPSRTGKAVDGRAKRGPAQMAALRSGVSRPVLTISSSWSNIAASAPSST